MEKLNTMLGQGVFLDLETIDRGDLDLAPLKAALADWDLRSLSEGGGVAQRIRTAEVVVTNKAPLARDALAQAEQMKLICAAATGVDHIDLEAARERDIVVCNARGYATPALAQHVFCLILALMTRLDDYCAEVRAGAWSQSRDFSLLHFPIRELAGKTLGIIGYGVLGNAVADLGRAFEMEILIAQVRTKAPDRVPLAELLQRADIVSLHCPLTPETAGLIGARELALMKNDALLINTARGGIVDEPALADALYKGRIGGAGIDALSREPPPSDHPLLAPGIPNLIVTPHIAWAAIESRQRLIDEVTANIMAFIRGKPRNRVA